MARVYAIDGLSASTSTGATTARRFATAGYEPGDAGGYYDPAVIDAVQYSRDALQDLRTFGASRVNPGVMRLRNADWHLDALALEGWDGQPQTVRTGDAGAAHAALDLVGTFLAQLPILTPDDEFHLQLADATLLLDQNLMPTTYRFGGTNALPAGHDGVDDIKGRPMPAFWGDVYGVPGVCSNTSQNIWTLRYRNPNGNVGIGAGYVAGVVITPGNLRANAAALEAGSPAGGTYDYSLGSGSEPMLAKFAAKPGGAVTFDLTEGTGDPAKSVAQIAKRMFAELIGNATLSAASVTALDLKNAAPCGIYAGDQDTTRRALLDELLASIGAFLDPDLTDASGAAFTLGRIEAASGSPVARFFYATPGAALAIGDYEATAMQLVQLSDPTAGLPITDMRLGYRQNYTIQTATDVAGAALARVTFTQSQYRYVTPTTPAVALGHLAPLPVEFPTCLRDKVDAQAEVDRRNTYYAAGRRPVQVTVPFDIALWQAVRQLGGAITVTGRFGLVNQLLQVLGVTLDLGEVDTMDIVAV